jgi:hypothetical protein
MRRKRLNHFPSAILGILNGHQMYGQIKYFWDKGAGTYVYDLLNNKLEFDGRPIPAYPIFEITKKWFDTDIIKNRIQKEKIESAQIRVDLKKKEERIVTIQKAYLFGLLKKTITLPNERDMLGEAKVTIRTDEKEYSKSLICVVWE